jgi:hypothetical protein
MKIGHDRANVLDFLHTRAELLQSRSIDGPQKNVNEVLPLSYDIHISAWTKKILSQAILSLRSEYMLIKQTVERKALFAAR